MDVDKALREHLRKLGAKGGRVGGKSKSPAKRRAILANLKKARAARKRGSK